MVNHAWRIACIVSAITVYKKVDISFNVAEHTAHNITFPCIGSCRTCAPAARAFSAVQSDNYCRRHICGHWELLAKVMCDLAIAVSSL